MRRTVEFNSLTTVARVRERTETYNTRYSLFGVVNLMAHVIKLEQRQAEERKRSLRVP